MVVGTPSPSTQCIDSTQTHMRHGCARSLSLTQSPCAHLPVARTTTQWSPKQSADTSPAVPGPPHADPGTHGCIYTPAHNSSADHSVEHCDSQLTSLGRFEWPENAGCSITGLIPKVQRGIAIGQMKGRQRCLFSLMVKRDEQVEEY